MSPDDLARLPPGWPTPGPEPHPAVGLRWPGRGDTVEAIAGPDRLRLALVLAVVLGLGALIILGVAGADPTGGFLLVPVVVLVAATVAVAHRGRLRAADRLASEVRSRVPGAATVLGQLGPEAIAVLGAVGVDAGGLRPSSAPIAVVAAHGQGIELWADRGGEPVQLVELPWEVVDLRRGRTRLGVLRRHALAIAAPGEPGTVPRLAVLPDPGVGIRLSASRASAVRTRLEAVRPR